MNKKYINITILVLLVAILAVYVFNMTKNNPRGNNETEISITTVEELKKDITAIVKGVYAPSNSEEYNDLKDKWNGKMGAVAYKTLFNNGESVELTEHDLQRVIKIHSINFGEAEWQSDKTPRIMVAFSVINVDTEEIFRLDSVFRLNEEGLIDTVTLTIR